MTGGWEERGAEDGVLRSIKPHHNSFGVRVGSLITALSPVQSSIRVHHSFPVGFASPVIWCRTR